MATLSGAALIFTMLALVVLGAIAGYTFASMRARLDGGGRKPAELKQEFETYRGKVDSHFETTNELLQKMTAQYREVYAHMAAGAQELCDVEPAKLDDHLRLEDMAAPVAGAALEQADEPAQDVTADGEAMTDAAGAGGADTAGAQSVDAAGVEQTTATAEEPEEGAAQPRDEPAVMANGAGASAAGDPAADDAGQPAPPPVANAGETAPAAEPAYDDEDDYPSLSLDDLGEAEEPVLTLTERQDDDAAQGAGRSARAESVGKAA